MNTSDSIQIIRVTSLGVPRVLETVQEIHALRTECPARIDVSDLQHVEPFGMLLLASAIRRAKSRFDNDGTNAFELVGRNDTRQGHKYASVMGLWRATDWTADAEQSVSQMPEASRSVIPATAIRLADLYRQAGGVDPVRSEIVLQVAVGLATKLVRGQTQTNLYAAIEYAICEMLRNCVEHSGASEIWIAAASRPTKGDTQVAILDEGHGIRQPLQENVAYSASIQSDVDAIRLALQPGVSRNAGKRRTKQQELKLRELFPDQDPAFYDNHGMGLSLVSDITRQAGQFLIVSGQSYLAYLASSSPIEGTSSHKGTGVRLVFHDHKVERALGNLVREYRGRWRHVHGSGALISASLGKRLGIADDD